MAKPLSVLPVRDRSEVRRFVDVAYHVHHDEPRWIPPLRSDATARVRFRRNPFWRRADGRLFIARRGQRMVGRVTAHLDRTQEGDPSVAAFGFFECVDDADVTAALIDAAAGFATTEGARALVGPVSWTALEEAGVLVEGFDQPADFLAPWHPPAYERLLRGTGAAPGQELLTLRIATGDGAGADAAATSGEGSETKRPRPADALRSLIDQAGLLDALVPDPELSWPPTIPEVKARFKRLRPLLDRDLLSVDAAAGVAVAVPDLNEVLTHLRDGVGPVRATRALAEARRHRRTAVVAMMAGDSARLVPRLVNRAGQAGYQGLELTALAGSPAVAVAEQLGAAVIRRYRTFRLGLET